MGSFLRALATLVVALLVAGRPAFAANGNGDWDPPRPWPLGGIHAVLLATGKVLHFKYAPGAGPGSHEGTIASIWDPVTDSQTIQILERDLFCGGHSQLPDGRVLVTGGTEAEPEIGIEGLLDTHLFDPFTETWTRVQDMARGRWYPTNVALGDGRTLVVGGLDENAVQNPLTEIYTPDVGWTVLPGLTREMPLYPHLFLLPSGEVFFAGPTRGSSIMDLTAETSRPVAAMSFDRYDGTPVMLPPGQTRFMVHGQLTGTRSADVIDLAAPIPAWQSAGRSRGGRIHANAVILPDGQVLVVGGGRRNTLFNPATNTWTKMDLCRRPRRYHSTAILLPDARVMVAGADGENTTETFSPPYLFRGPRPVIVAAPLAVGYGETFAVETDGTPAGAVAFLRPGAVTHSVNMEQRYVALTFDAAGGTLTVTAPAEPNRAPPGYYMLFVVTPDGVPSGARFVRLGAS